MLASIPLDKITASDIERLIISGVAESVWLDFKRDDYSDKAKESRKERLKDISAMANSEGGDILVGLDEDDEGFAGELTPIEITNPDDYQLRLRGIIRENFDPPISGIDLALIESGMALGDGGAKRYYVVVRIPQSMNAPHMAKGGLGRFYIRNGTRNDPATTQEIGNLLVRSKKMQERALEFHDARGEELLAERNALSVTIPNRRLGPGLGGIRGTGSPSYQRGFFLAHLTPLSRSEPHVELNLKSSVDVPLGQYATFSKAEITIDGLKSLFTNDGKPDGWIMKYRNGTIEAFRVGMVYQADPGPDMPPAELAHELIEDFIADFPSDILEASDILSKNPSIFSLTIFEVSSVVSSSSGLLTGRFGPRIDRNIVSLPPIFLEPGITKAEARRAVRPMLDALAGLAGVGASKLYDEEGNWRSRYTF